MTEWPKKVTVDKRIVQILSGATYDNFPKALKELVTNSYDADASLVNININLNNEEIIVEDDGVGMSEEDFDFFLRIAYKKREKGISSKSGRKIIGQFGVGFLSVFPFCKRYQIASKKKGSTELIYADIPCARYFSSQKRLVDVSEIPIPGGKKVDNNIDAQYTIITLSGFTDLTRVFFDPNKFEGASNKFSIKNYQGIEKLKWILSEDLPIKYEEYSFNQLFPNSVEMPFTVKFNGSELTRKIYGKTILEINSGEFEQIGKIKFKYFISTGYSVIHPIEARHLKIRNLNVGVGDRTSFGVGSESGNRARINHLTGEVHILEGLNDLIALDRDSFNYDEDFEKLKNTLRSRLIQLSLRLEDIADLENYLKHSSNLIRINDLELLDNNGLFKLISNLEKQGFVVHKEAKNKINEQPVSLNKDKKEITLFSELSKYTRKINLNNKEYEVTVDKWDPQESQFPACKIEQNQIVLNKSYPYFSGRKYTDLIFRIHTLLLMSLKEGTIDRKTYHKLIAALEQLLSDYL